MKKILTLCLYMLMPLGLFAQQFVEGTSYYLPRTAIQFNVLVERTITEPGELCMYAERFLKKKDVAQQSATQFRIVGIDINCLGIRDTSKFFTPNMDAKHSIVSLKINDDGIILAVNDQPKEQTERTPFVPAPKKPALNPHDYMNQDILAAGSSAKTAELAAQDIYDIRESRSQLARGQADFMPKDGEQLKLMLANLDTQEQALLQLFEGVTERDTMEAVFTYVPDREVQRHVLFRFSKRLGLLDEDDLAGEPYYVGIEDLHAMPSNTAVVEDGKKSKDDANIYVTLPGKIRLTFSRSEQQLLTKELYAAQFGKTAPLDNELFGKKLFTRVVYNPITGSVEEIKTEMMKK